jgi:hypothetical protein
MSFFPFKTANRRMACRLPLRAVKFRLTRDLPGLICTKPNWITFESPTIRRQSQLECAIGDSSAQNDASTANPLASKCVRRKCYESCSRSCCQQFVADQRRSTTSTRTQSGARQNACERHLLHRRTFDARTLSGTISPNLRPRASRRDRCRGSRRHDPEGGRPRGYRLDSIHLRALRMVPAWA